MAASGGRYQRFYSPAAVDRIIEAAGGFPEPSEEDAERRREIDDALEFAAMEVAGTFVGRLVQHAEGRRPAEPRGRGRPSQVEIQRFVEACQGIWLDVFNKRFRTSRDILGEGAGPQVRFLDACRRELRDSLQAGPATLVVFQGQPRPSERQALVEALDRLTPSPIEARARRSSWPKTVRALINARFRYATRKDLAVFGASGDSDSDQ